MFNIYPFSTFFSTLYENVKSKKTKASSDFTDCVYVNNTKILGQNLSFKKNP